MPVPVFSAAFPARTSAFSFPTMLAWPLNQVMATGRPRLLSDVTIRLMARAWDYPGPAPVCPVMALFESE